MLQIFYISKYLLPRCVIISTFMQHFICRQAKLHTAALLFQLGVKINCLYQHQNNVLIQHKINQIKESKLYQNLNKIKIPNSRNVQIIDTVNTICSANHQYLRTQKTQLYFPPQSHCHNWKHQHSFKYWQNFLSERGGCWQTSFSGR
jgi:hypothetical protein